MPRSASRGYAEWSRADRQRTLDNLHNKLTGRDKESIERQRKVKDKYFILWGTVESGYLGHSKPMSYVKALEKKREHDDENQFNDPFPDFMEVHKWKGKNAVNEIVKKLFGWMEGRTFLQNKE